MAKPHYRQAKRQKELARKARQEEKMHRRSERTHPTAETGAGEPGATDTNTDSPPALVREQ